MPAKKRELVDTDSDKRYIRRDTHGRFGSDQVDVGKSSAADQKRPSATPSKHGQGDEGDRPSDS